MKALRGGPERVLVRRRIAEAFGRLMAPQEFGRLATAAFIYRELATQPIERLRVDVVGDAAQLKLGPVVCAPTFFAHYLSLNGSYGKNGNYRKGADPACPLPPIIPITSMIPILPTATPVRVLSAGLRAIRIEIFAPRDAEGIAQFLSDTKNEYPAQHDWFRHE